MRSMESDVMSPLLEERSFGDATDLAACHMRHNLQYYLRQVQESILCCQNPITGLISGKNLNGHAWIRDNTYAIHCCWGLYLVFKKLADMDEEMTMARELEKLVVKCMRSLLMCMMHQSNKVECFKKAQHVENSLHAKYNAATLRTVVGDFEWGHLQIDAVALYLLTLAQMTASGIQLIYTLDEVAFVQNLVFYIESAYRIPDYGIWERGDKSNHGLPELNSTSIGMTKAALEAMTDLNLFGSKGGPESIVHVLADESQQCGAVLQSMLPRESCSKEADAGLLGIIGYPAFAVDNQDLINHTRQTIIEKLGGRYGCCRFLRDGHCTAKEDKRRLHYEFWELKVFENIECEWPLFTVYLLLDAIYRGDRIVAIQYAEQLDGLLVKKDGLSLVPEAYAVPIECVDAEYAVPQSQTRKPVGQLPHIWAQSLYILACMMLDGLLLPGEVDPLGRRMIAEPKPDHVVQVVLAAEDELIQAKLAEYGITVQTFEEINHSSDVKIFPARVLGHFYRHLGKCAKLGLSGRHTTDVGILATSKLYRVGNQILAFTPQFVDQQVYYLSHDVEFVLDIFKTNANFLYSSWRNMGRPLFIIPIIHWYFRHEARSQNDADESPQDNVHSLQQLPLIKAIRQLQSRYISGTRVIVGNLEDFVSTSCITEMTFLDSYAGLAEDIMQRAGRSSESHARRRLCQNLGGCMSAPAAASLDLSKSDDGTVDGTLDAAGLRAAAQAARRRKSVVPSSSMWSSQPTPLVPENSLFLASTSDEVTQHLRQPVQPSASGCSLLRLLASSSLATTLSANPSQSSLLTPSDSMNEINQSDGKISGLHLHLADNLDELVHTLVTTEDLYEQFEIILRLLEKRGMDWNTNLEDGNVTVRDLIKEVYARAGQMKQWWLARTTAGLLRKRVEDLSKALTDLLVRQKQVTVGPPNNERVIERPLPPEKLADCIHECWQVDPSLAMLTQEMLVYLAMYVRTEPHLFDQMIRIRVGLIIEIMLTELVRAMKLDEALADAHLMNLSPFEVKKLLHHILSGQEFRAEFVNNSDEIQLLLRADVEDNFRHGPAGKQLARRLSKFAMSVDTVEAPSQLGLEGNTGTKLDSLQSNDRHGQWVRRRMIDGSLNRVPPGFYPQLWKLLVRCGGIRIGNQYLGQNLTQEMTEGEVKFALQVEGILTAVPIPEYRQLLVEALCVLGRLLDAEGRVKGCPSVEFGQEIVVDRLVERAYCIYLEDQKRFGGVSAECCCLITEFSRSSVHLIRHGHTLEEEKIQPCGGKQGLCIHFYDCAPSGRFGTMSYLVRALSAVVKLPCREDGAIDLNCSLQ